MSEFKPIVSSNLEAASYDAATETLIVKFRRLAVQYKYQNIPATIYAEFEKTFDGANGNSPGRFFQRNFRDLPFEKIEE